MKRSIETSDIVLAVTLKVKGYSLERLEKVGNKGTFCFAEVADELVSNYHLGKVLVEPNDFNNALKSLVTATRRVL